MDDQIDFGQGPNTGTGDTIRVAFEKLQRRIAVLEADITPPLPGYTPSLSFNDARNSAYAGAL